MLATLWLLACTFTSGQVNQWQLQPQLARGQELVYSGSFTEEALSPGVQFMARSHKVETTVLVLDATPQKFDLAFLTVVTSKEAKSSGGPGKASPSSVRLEVVPMDRQGKLQPKSVASLRPPLEGPPSVECGVFLEFPKSKLGLQDTWDVSEEGRTPRTWRVDGTDAVDNVQCIRLVGVQQSEDWAAPRGDRSAWRRFDTLWISTQDGVTRRYERVCERREAARVDPTHRSVLTCELTSALTYPGKFFDERCAEIKEARKYFEDSDALLREPEQHKVQLEQILNKIKQYCAAVPATKYRDAVLQVQKRVEAGLHGQTVPDQQEQEDPAPTTRVAVGQRVPDFVYTDLLTRKTLRLDRLLGKPIVIMFYYPNTDNGQRVLRFGQGLAERFPQGVSVMAMAVTDDVELVRKQHTDMQLPFSILDGTGLVQFFGADGFPRIVVLDGQGVVRLATTGWGGHSAGEVTGVVQKLVPR